jgi:RNA polymerase sigma-70 factor, ECF subfamily
MTTQALDLFQEHRDLLFGIAYRMLGTVMDAQDMVQETFLRWQRTSLDEVKSPRAWLTTIITRLCINHLKSARVQRETYMGTWLPEPLIERDSAENAQLADSLSLAFLVLLETLTPTERAVFILREVLNCEFSEIAPIVKRSEVTGQCA